MPRHRCRSARELPRMHARPPGDPDRDFHRNRRPPEKLPLRPRGELLAECISISATPEENCRAERRSRMRRPSSAVMSGRGSRTDQSVVRSPSSVRRMSVSPAITERAASARAASTARSSSMCGMSRLRSVSGASRWRRDGTVSAMRAAEQAAGRQKGLPSTRLPRLCRSVGQSPLPAERRNVRSCESQACAGCSLSFAAEAGCRPETCLPGRALLTGGEHGGARSGPGRCIGAEACEADNNGSLEAFRIK